MAGLSDFEDLDPGAKYAEDFEKNLQKSLQILNRDIDRLVRGIKEEKATKSQEAALEYLLANRKQLEDAVAGQVTANLDATVRDAYKDLLKLSADEMDARDIHSDLHPSDVRAFESSYQNVSVWFETASRASARSVFNALMNFVVTGSQGQILEFVANMNAEKYIRYGNTIIHSHLNAFYQQANNIRASRAGVVRYKYSGPSPRREFCAAIIGKTFTVDEIKQMDNGQTGDVFHTCGGYNCRHRWVPIAPTAEDRKYQKPAGNKVQTKLEKEKVGNGSLFDSGKGKVLMKSKGVNIGLIQRSIFTDDRGPYYRRFTGEKEYLKKDSSGRLYIEAFAPKKAARGRNKAGASVIPPTSEKKGTPGERGA